MRYLHALLAMTAAGILSSGVAEAGTVYVANEVSNTVSVIDTATNRVTATINTGDENHHRPLYNGIIDAHGANLSPDGKLLAVTGRGSSNVLFIDTATNQVVAEVLVGREPHVPTFTPDGREAWVTLRGRDYAAVVDTKTFQVTRHIKTMNGPSMLWFSPDGRRAYIAEGGDPLDAGHSAVAGHLSQRGRKLLPVHQAHPGREAGVAHPQDRGQGGPARPQAPAELAAVGAGGYGLAPGPR